MKFHYHLPNYRPVSLARLPIYEVNMEGIKLKKCVKNKSCINTLIFYNILGYENFLPEWKRTFIVQKSLIKLFGY